MPRTWSALRWAPVLLAIDANFVVARDLRPAVFANAGVANLYRAGDRSFGTELNLGAGAGLEGKRLAIDVDLHRTLGLAPRPVDCAILNVPCAGSAREGFLEAGMLAGNVSYFFGSRVRPYVTGSLGVIWTESVNSLTTVTGTAATLREFRERDTGLAFGFGVGVDVPLTDSISLRPEFRTYSSVVLSRINVGLHRGTLGVRYRW